LSLFGSRNQATKRKGSFYKGACLMKDHGSLGAVCLIALEAPVSGLVFLLKSPVVGGFGALMLGSDFLGLKTGGLGIFETPLKAPPGNAVFSKGPA